MLKIAFAGMGSIGKQHFRNLCTLFQVQKRDYIVDLYRSGIGTALTPELSSKVRKTFLLAEGEPITEYYDVVFVTNPTSEHYETVRRFAGASRAMFLEKPVFDHPDVDLENLCLRTDGIYYVACPLRYHPVIQYIRSHVSCEQAYAVRAICSSYLPDWRPGTDYRTCYSAKKNMGGGVDIDLIHEWDYLNVLFGPVYTGFAILDRVSELKIDSNDLAIYIALTAHTAIELHLDYFGRKPVRQMQIFLPEDTVDCNLLTGDISWYVSGKHIHLDCGKETYQMAELQHFFEILDGKRPNDSKVTDALRILRYARGEFGT